MSIDFQSTSTGTPVLPKSQEIYFHPHATEITTGDLETGGTTLPRTAGDEYYRLAMEVRPEQIREDQDRLNQLRTDPRSRAEVYQYLMDRGCDESIALATIGVVAMVAWKQYRNTGNPQTALTQINEAGEQGIPAATVSSQAAIASVCQEDKCSRHGAILQFHAYAEDRGIAARVARSASLLQYGTREMAEVANEVYTTLESNGPETKNVLCAIADYEFTPPIWIPDDFSVVYADPYKLS